MTPQAQVQAHDRDPPPNTCARTRALGSFTVVEVTGEVDLATAYLVAEHLDAATAPPEPNVLVDLRPADFLDCSALRVLCRAEKRARERGGSLRVVSDDPRVRRLLGAAGLLGRFPLLPRLPGESNDAK
ncbi:STAS domain-containing protein [Streptomyces sp. NPDC001315]|uniref:STAS domain-containing protein n=1 Tax=Streptomyces sp. NPDC001315 TaxID=3364562 RepID=UPI0036B655F3